MLTKKQVLEIRKHLEKAQNPVFFFDNDPDGLCSFLLLRRYIGRGKGVAVRSFPDLSLDYFRKVNEFNADYIFILDKPVVSKEFFEEAEKFNIPVVWIDHHKIEEKPPEFVNYYNPVYNRLKKNEPVTYLCYNITNKKEDKWLGVVGCISDKYLPNFYNEFRKEYPDLAISSKNPSDIYYNSPIGTISKIFSFALKDRTTNVVNMIKFLLKARNPYEVLDETFKNKTMHSRFKEINNKYRKLLQKAIEESGKNKLLFFQYGGDLSMSADLANELSYRFSKKIIAVAYIKGIKVNISLRGKKIRKIALKAIENFKDATGGGHKEAVGVKINVKDLEIFKKRLQDMID